jgi:hypothetical protein
LGAADDHGRGANALRMIRGEREDVRAASAAAGRMHGLETEMVEELRRVVGDDRDPSFREAGRRAVARAIEGEQPNRESVVYVLVRMTVVPRPRSALKREDRPTVGRSVLLPRKRPPVPKREPPVAHEAKLWR